MRTARVAVRVTVLAASTAGLLIPWVAAGSPVTDTPPPTAGERAADSSAATIARETRERHLVQGLVCAIVGKEGVRDIGASGIRRKGAPEAITADDRMHLGSCTKAFTATLAAVLVADGTLSWSSTVGEVLGGSIPAMHDDWRAVTLEQLLRHRGGAPKEPPTGAWRAAFACTDSPRACRAAFLGELCSRKPTETAGTFVYSNQGYALAGHMLEVKAGKEYEALLAERVLAPLGIARAGFGPPKRTEEASPWGHDEQGMPFDIDNPNAIAPAGTLHMPLRHWARFIAFHLGGTPPEALAGAATQLAVLHARAATEPFEGLGWRTADRAWGGAVLTHAGSNSKWFCVAWLSPEKGFAVIAAVNQGGDRAQRACDEACSALIRTLEAPE
jgi:CubicO group peptidase (beta-lactamase class C family)